MSEFRHLIRIAGKDIDGKKKVAVALADLKGVGVNLASMMLHSLNIDGKLRLGALNEDQLLKIETSLKNLDKLGIPSWALNRRKDIDTGSDTHFVGADLQMSLRRDIDRERSVMSWRGVRHSLGLKVRGQRTRCTGRKGRSVGVRKTVRAPAASAAAS
jgi:small subunit ribosomal protein S13